MEFEMLITLVIPLRKYKISVFFLKNTTSKLIYLIKHIKRLSTLEKPILLANILNGCQN
jgi:hypothetical protein